MIRKSKPLAGCVGLCGVLLASSASAQNLITNGGFETGDFSGWSQFGNTGFTFVSTDNPESGNYSAWFGPVGSNGGISQSFATEAGTTYDLNFRFLLQEGTPNYLEWSVNGTTLGFFSDIVIAPVWAYIPGISFVADTETSTLAFTVRHDPAYLQLDSISVTQALPSVPEPQAWALLILGFGVVGGGLRTTRRSSARVTFQHVS